MHCTTLETVEDRFRLGTKRVILEVFEMLAFFYLISHFFLIQVPHVSLV